MSRSLRAGGAEDDSERGFELFDLSLTLGPSLTPWVSAASRLGHVHGVPCLDPAIPPLGDLLDEVYDFVDAVQYAEREALPNLKRALSALAFGEPTVLELFQATRGVAAEHGRELLVRILASPHLAALPWELLPDPGKGGWEREGNYLALAPDASIARLARGRTYPIRLDRLAPPLNLLIVLSSPSGRGLDEDSLAFDIFEEKRALLSELEPLERNGLIRVDVEYRPTLQNLRRRIGAQARGYHMFHYLGHAEPDKLILEDENGRREDQRARDVLEVLRLCPDLRLAMFAGCETARAAGDPLTIDSAATGDWRSILSLSDRCVQHSCPVVIGMQAVLPFRTEGLFNRYFYQGIASGYSVTGAMRLARGATRGDRHVGGALLDWAVPALFLGGPDPGPLLDRAARGVRLERPARQALRLGLKQGETRFFARDVALRQSIDILSGAAPERVLALTGPAGVGKTTLIDRALEEMEERAAILYLRLEDIAPELKGSSVWTFPGEEVPEWMSALAEMDVNGPVKRLCDLVAERLALLDGRRRSPEVGHTPLEWWERLIEEIGPRRFVLTVDDLGQLVKAEAALARRIVSYWLDLSLRKLKNESNVSSVADLLREAVGHVRSSAGLTQRPGDTQLLVSEMHELQTWLGGWTSVARETLVAEAEACLARGDPVVEAAPPQAKLKQEERRQEILREAAQRLVDLRCSLSAALKRIGERRSGARLAIIGDRLPDDLIRLSSDQRFEMRLGRLTWFETWRWIRRNLPGLLRYGEAYLERLWPRLGANLALWEELERKIVEACGDEPNVAKLVDDLSPQRARGGTTLPGYKAPRGERPLRVAIAGPHIASADALAHAVTRLAVEHGVGGLAVAGEEEKGSLAVMVDVPSPFRNGQTATENEMLEFLKEVCKEDPDIVLLDYGQSVPLPWRDTETPQRRALRQLSNRALLIAAGGNAIPQNRPEATVPAIFPEVLSVGPMNGEAQMQPYAEWWPEFHKPDVFMLDDLTGAALEGALAQDEHAPGQPWQGSSFSALNAVGAAILAWSTAPTLTPNELKELLRRAAKPMGTRTTQEPRALTVQDAVDAARRKVIERDLKDGACSLQTLAAISGLDVRHIDRTLDALIAEGSVRRLTRGRLERYEWMLW